MALVLAAGVVCDRIAMTHRGGFVTLAVKVAAIILTLLLPDMMW